LPSQVHPTIQPGHRKFKNIKREMFDGRWCTERNRAHTFLHRTSLLRTHPAYCAAQITKSLKNYAVVPTRQSCLNGWLSPVAVRHCTPRCRKKEQLDQSPLSPSTCIHSGDLLLSRSLRSSETPVTAGEIDQCSIFKTDDQAAPASYSGT
jgi:hypothetical protein